MIHLELTLIHFVLLLPIAHLINTILLAWIPHFLLHQRIFGIPLYKVHLYSHHQPNHSSSLQRHFLALLEHSLWISMSGFFLVLYQFLFTQWIAWLFTLEGLFGAIAAYYLHSEYDNPQSWFKGYAWFYNSRKLHHIHHYYSRKDIFSNSKNYSFGGLGLQGHFADRLMGTFQPLETVSKLHHD